MWLGRVVSFCIAERRTLRDLQPDELGRFAPILAERPPDLSARASADAREVAGGTAWWRCSRLWERPHATGADARMG